MKKIIFFATVSLLIVSSGVDALQVIPLIQSSLITLSQDRRHGVQTQGNEVTVLAMRTNSVIKRILCERPVVTAFFVNNQKIRIVCDGNDFCDHTILE